MKKLLLVLLLAITPHYAMSDEAITNTIDGFVSGSYGYQKFETEYLDNGSPLKFKGPIYAGRVSVAFPLANQFGMQIDVSTGQEHFVGGGSPYTFDRELFDSAGHLFFRDPNQFLVGIVGQYGKQVIAYDSGFDLPIKSYQIGVEFTTT